MLFLFFKFFFLNRYFLNNSFTFFLQDFFHLLLQILFNYSIHQWDSPLMSFISKKLKVSWRFKKIGIIYGFLSICRIPLVAIGFLILIIIYILKSEALQLHFRSIDDYSFIKRVLGQGVLHSAHYLEFVLINSADVGNCRHCKIKIFILIFFNESFANVVEIKLVQVFEMHFVVFLKSLHVHLHHFWKFICFVFGLFAKLHDWIQSLVKMYFFIICFHYVLWFINNILF